MGGFRSEFFLAASSIKPAHLAGDSGGATDIADARCGLALDTS